MFAPVHRLSQLLRLVAVLSPIALLSACLSLPGGGGSGQMIDPRAPVPVALLVPYGAAANEQKLAKDLENAARMASRDLQGVTIDLRVYPTAGQPGKAVESAQRAINDGAKIILGPLYAEAANAVATATSAANVNVLAFSNNPTIAGGNLFILGATYDNAATQLAAYGQAQGKTRIVSVYDNNVAGQLGKAAIDAAVARQGGTVTANIGYDFSESGVVSAIPRIKAAVNETNADAIFMTANSAGALPLLAQMLPEAGVSPTSTQYIGLSRWDTPAQTLGLPGLQGGWFALPDPNRSAQYSQRFKATYGYVPHVISSLAYDGIAAIGALAKSGKRDALQTSGLTQNAGFEGATGVFRLRADGSNERALAIGSVRNNQVVILKPAANSFGASLF